MNRSTPPTGGHCAASHIRLSTTGSTTCRESVTVRSGSRCRRRSSRAYASLHRGCRRAPNPLTAISRNWCCPMRWATRIRASGPGTWATARPSRAVGDFLAAVVNPNMGGGNHAPNHVEAQVVDWCKEIVGFPRESERPARERRLDGEFRRPRGRAQFPRPASTCAAEGVAAIPRPLITYASVEVHSCVQKAIESLGLGAHSLRKVPVNAGFRNRRRRARTHDRGGPRRGPAAVLRDRQRGHDQHRRDRRPRRARHALRTRAALVPRRRRDRRACSRWRRRTVTWCAASSARIRSRSTCTNGCTCRSRPACVLVRDRKAHREAFALTPEYLEHTERGLASGRSGSASTDCSCRAAFAR